MIASSPDPLFDGREVALYLPPGFTENPKPVYDLIHMLDFGVGAFGNLRAQVIDKEHSSIQEQKGTLHKTLNDGIYPLHCEYCQPFRSFH